MNDPLPVTHLMHCSYKNSDGVSGSEGKLPCESKKLLQERDIKPEHVGCDASGWGGIFHLNWKTPAAPDIVRKQTKVWRQTTLVLVVGSSKVLQISRATTGLAPTPLDVTVNGSQRSGETPLKTEDRESLQLIVNYSFWYLIKAPCFSVRSIRAFVDDAKRKHFDSVRSCFLCWKSLLWRHVRTTRHLLLIADADNLV